MDRNLGAFQNELAFCVLCVGFRVITHFLRHLLAKTYSGFYIILFRAVKLFLLIIFLWEVIDNQSYYMALEIIFYIWFLLFCQTVDNFLIGGTVEDQDMLESVCFLWPCINGSTIIWWEYVWNIIRILLLFTFVLLYLRIRSLRMVAKRIWVP